MFVGPAKGATVIRARSRRTASKPVTLSRSQRDGSAAGEMHGDGLRLIHTLTGHHAARGPGGLPHAYTIRKRPARLRKTIDKRQGAVGFRANRRTAGPVGVGLTAPVSASDQFDSCSLYGSSPNAMTVVPATFTGRPSRCDAASLREHRGTKPHHLAASSTSIATWPVTRAEVVALLDAHSCVVSSEAPNVRTRRVATNAVLVYCCSGVSR
jgi:hypothetical protein